MPELATSPALAIFRRRDGQRHERRNAGSPGRWGRRPALDGGGGCGILQGPDGLPEAVDGSPEVRGLLAHALQGTPDVSGGRRDRLATASAAERTRSGPRSGGGVTGRCGRRWRAWTGALSGQYGQSATPGAENSFPFRAAVPAVALVATGPASLGGHIVGYVHGRR